MDERAVENILSSLSDTRNFNDPKYCHLCLKKIMQYSVKKSADMSVFLPAIVNMMAHSDLLVKKAACQLLTKISGAKCELMVLAVNTLLKDMKESNPVIRALAIRTMCNVKHEAFQEHCISCITTGIADNSSYVRRAAIMACLSVFHISNEQGNVWGEVENEKFQGSGLVHKLYEMIRDSDPVVSVDCLLVLNELLRDEGGVVLNKKLVGYLLKRISEYTPWGIAYVAKLIQKYKPKCEDEIFDIMNCLDPYLDHSNPVVCINTLEIFIGLISDMPHLSEDIFMRTQSKFLSIFSSGNVELMTTTLNFCRKYPSDMSKMLINHHKTLFCKVKEPSYLKVEKLNFVVTLVNVDNFKDILEEIVTNCYDNDTDVSLCAIQCLGRLVRDFPDLSDKLMKAFNKLLHSDKSHVVCNTLQVLVSLSSQNIKCVGDIGIRLCTIARDQTDTEGRTAALYLITSLDTDSSELLYMFECFIEEYDDLDSKVKCQLLLTVVKLFCTQPARYQYILSDVLDLCINDGVDRDIVEQAKFYYSVLEANPGLSQTIFQKDGIFNSDNS
ncbi:hypothetical protein ACF0H5_007835 [Mactra antiquata]